MGLKVTIYQSKRVARILPCVIIKTVVLTYSFSITVRILALGDAFIQILRFVLHQVVCLTTGPRCLSKPVLRTERSSASSFKFQYRHVSI